jgi:hypothetical protein
MLFGTKFEHNGSSCGAWFALFVRQAERRLAAAQS